MGSNVIADLRVIDEVNSQPVWVKHVDGKIITINHVWNPDTLAYEAMTQPALNTDMVKIASKSEEALLELVQELKIMNLHLRLMTDEKITEEDL